MRERLVTLDLDDHLAVVTIRRPAARNAINEAVTADLAAIVDRIEGERQVRAVILTGEGGTFCAGADLSVVAAGGMDTLFHPEKGFAGFVAAARTKPWIAAVTGHAVAGGFEIALACDMIVASSTAAFGLPEVRRGIIAAAGGAYRLPRLIPPMLATELILTGRLMSAREAERWGLVNRVAEADTLLAEAIMLGKTIAANAPLAVRASLHVMRMSFNSADDLLMTESRKQLTGLMTTQDYSEGPRAFLEKRPARWSGQ